MRGCGRAFKSELMATGDKMTAKKQNANRLVLVTGATGKLGGAVARHLLGRDFRVRALTGDPRKKAAGVLAQQGAEVVRGDLDNPATLERALKGVYGLFSVQNFRQTDIEGEVRQGLALAGAAKLADVKHFVYSSVGSAHRRTGIPHFESKWHIEECVRKIAIPYTILRPVFFMQNWDAHWRAGILGGALALPLDPEKSLQQASVEDVGAFAALAFERPEKWLGREVDLAGDELTMLETARMFAQVIGRPVHYIQLSWDGFQRAYGKEMTIMFKWLNDVGYDANIPELRKEYPGLTAFETYLRKSGWGQRRA